jgi:hypothetical protein
VLLVKPRQHRARSSFGKTSILFSCASLAAFLAANLIGSGAIFENNPLLTPLGYLVLIDWTPRLWQISALVVSVLSLALVFMVSSVNGEYEIAAESGDKTALKIAERKFGYLQRIGRLRFIFALLFWLLVIGQALLYLNQRRCFFQPSTELQIWARTIYGSHYPGDRCRPN